MTRIAIRQDKSTGSEQALLAEIYEAIRETVQVKNGDRFMAITESSDSKLTMHERVVEQLGRNPEVWPEDILIWVVETAAGRLAFRLRRSQFCEAPSHT